MEREGFVRVQHFAHRAQLELSPTPSPTPSPTLSPMSSGMAELEWSDVKEALDEVSPSFTDDGDNDSISNEESLFVREKKEKKEKTYLKVKKDKKDKTKCNGKGVGSMGNMGGMADKGSASSGMGEDFIL